MPQSGDQKLLNAARASLEEATPLKEKFIQHEMPADFLDELQAELETFQEALSGKNQVTETRVRATASLDALMERGMTAMRRLNPIVRNKYRHDPAAIAAWESASHVERNNRRSNDQQKQDAARPGPSVGAVTK